MNIKILSDVVANRIAAGEVVERPASAVKELVENSLDAGATNISVELEGAGKKLVRVEDDGLGMEPDDALLSLERHATSKISSEEDIAAITSMGFRGEALPSIASVSSFTMTTRAKGSPDGVRLVVEGGRLVTRETVGAPVGTSVEVRGLFKNVPARKKFLKSDATELRNIVEAVTNIAFMRNEVGFSLSSAGRSILNLPRGQSRRDRVRELHGGVRLFWHSSERPGLAMTLAFASPHEGKGNRKGMRFFVNKRAIADKLLFRAVMDGYRGLLEHGRYPSAILWIDMDPEKIDVNVHPAKREVRFSDEGRVFSAVAGFVAEALSAAPWMEGAPGETGPVAPSPYPVGGEGVSSERSERIAEAVADYASGSRSERGSYSQGGFSYRQPYSTSSGASPSPYGRGGKLGNNPESFINNIENEKRAPLGDGDAPLVCRFGSLRFLGSFDATYLLFEDLDSKELVILDQHAAHERILYEFFLNGAGGSVASQASLVPVLIEGVGKAVMETFGEKKGLLHSMGFEAEVFGDATIAVKRAPANLSSSAIEAVVRDFVEASDEGEALEGEKELREAAAARAACSAAVKAGSSLLPSEARALIEKLELLEHPSHCPHGRPLMIRMGRARLESLFHRT